VADEVPFPPGYATTLPHGNREDAAETRPITKAQDATALAYVVGQLHQAFFSDGTNEELGGCVLPLHQIESFLRKLDTHLKLAPAPAFAKFIEKCTVNCKSKRKGSPCLAVGSDNNRLIFRM
jgi:hypothetical protein